MTSEELEKKVKDNLEYLDSIFDELREPSAEDIDRIIGHGMILSSVSGLLSKTLVDANRLLKMKELYFMNTNQGLWNSPTILKKLMESNLSEHHSYVLLADRYLAACVHKMDFYRSILSKHKEELKMNSTFNQR